MNDCDRTCKLNFDFWLNMNGCNCKMQQRIPKKFRCRSKRLQNLAKPKLITPKFSSCNTSSIDNKFKVQIISEEQTPVRIKMLSFPKVRKLVATRREFDGVVDEEWNERFKELIDKSKLTLYSRLANVTLPPASHGQLVKKKWTHADWQRHSEWLKKNAEPKPIFVAKEQPPKSVYMKRYRQKSTDEDLDEAMERLARPRHPRKKFRPFCGYKSTVETSALKYKISERTLKLSTKTIKSPPQEESQADHDPFSVNVDALKAKPSKRILELAKPKAIRRESIEPTVTEFGILARSLKASSSQRTLELAKPREKDDDDDDEARPSVNPKALKAKPSKRILELAQPRVKADV